MSYIIFVALSMMWGSNFILMKKATLWFDPVTVGGLRIAGAVLFLGAVRMARQREWPLSRDHFWPLLFVAALGYAFPFALQPIQTEKRRLRLNFRTPPAGSIRVQLLDGKGREIPGRGFDDCDWLCGDELDREVTWKGEGDLALSENGVLTVCFRMRCAQLFSARFA